MTDQQQPNIAAVIEQMAHATRQHTERHRAGDRATILTAMQANTTRGNQQPQTNQSTSDAPNTQG